MNTTSEVFKPGDTVPISGLYDVIHDKFDGENHAASHYVVATAGEIFPSCRGCETCARFQLYTPAEHFGANAHFKR